MESGLGVRCAADGVWCASANRVDTTRLAGVGHNRACQPEPPVPGFEQFILTPFLPPFLPYELSRFSVRLPRYTNSNSLQPSRRTTRRLRSTPACFRISLQ